VHGVRDSKARQLRRTAFSVLFCSVLFSGLGRRREADMFGGSEAWKTHPPHAAAGSRCSQWERGESWAVSSHAKHVVYVCRPVTRRRTRQSLFSFFSVSPALFHSP
jgi:hypothetical protein